MLTAISKSLKHKKGFEDIKRSIDMDNLLMGLSFVNTFLGENILA